MQYYQVPMHVFANPMFWLSVVGVSMLCVGSSLAVLYYQRTYHYPLPPPPFFFC